MPAILLFSFWLMGFASPEVQKESDIVTLATISHSLSGCFAYHSDQLTLYRKDTAYFATLTSDKKSRSLSLTREEVSSIYNFIQECKNRPKTVGFCTTQETYRIEVDEQQLTLTDASCTWRGYEKLQKMLLLAEPSR